MDYASQTSQGNIAAETGDTFWSAARTILEQTVSVLSDNAHAIFVTKDYIRAGARVPFTNQWITLCQSVGLRLLHHHRAMLVEEHGTQTDLFQGEVEQKTIKASFFRRLHMKKCPDLAILWEDVTCWVLDGPGGQEEGVACVVASPPFGDNIASAPRVGKAATYTGHHEQDYGSSIGQLGAMKEGERPTDA